MDEVSEYYHDSRMKKMFQLLEEPKSLVEIDISEAFIKNLVLKIISTYGTIVVNQMHEITGLHVDILEEVLKKLDKEDMVAQTGEDSFFQVWNTPSKLRDEKSQFR